MTTTRLFIVCVMGIAVAFLGANAPWIHAAFVGAITGASCPEDLVNAAEARIEAFFGEKLASPWTFCLAGPAYGLDVSHGATRFAAFLPAIAVIGPEGRNAEVIAHEIAHAEISARTGPLLRTYKMPTWFDEGLAMQVDHRIAYNRTSLNAYRTKPNASFPSLNKIASPALFFRDGEVGRIHYALAKCVIEEWRREHGPHALNDLLGKIGWFSVFPSALFGKSEEICTSGTKEPLSLQFRTSSN